MDGIGLHQAFGGKSGSCHLFRYTTLMLENGADVRFVQAMLGYAQLMSRQMHTQVAILELKEIDMATHSARPEQQEIKVAKLTRPLHRVYGKRESK